MTKKELKLKEKLYPIQQKISKFEHEILPSFNEKFYLNNEKYISLSFDILLTPLNKILKDTNFYAQFSKKQYRIQIFKKFTDSSSELIGEVYYYNFPHRIQFPIEDPISIKFKYYSSVKDNNLEFLLNKFIILGKISKYLLKNQSSLISKLKLTHSKHKKIALKISKKTHDNILKLQNLHKRRNNIIHPKLIKDLKNGVTIEFNNPQPFNFPQNQFEDVLNLKLLKDNSFVLKVESFGKTTIEQLEYKIKVDDLQKLIENKNFLNQFTLLNIKSPAIYNQVLDLTPLDLKL